MPIILEVNDYDSENDLSSTEDDNTNLSNIENKRKKNVKKSKKVKSKKPQLKESKIVKDTAKKKIKNMEKQILKTKYEYSDKKIKKEEIKNEEIKNEENEQIREFFTDAELADQFEELRKLEKTQKKLWKYSANSHVAIPETVRRGNLYKSAMPLMVKNSSMFRNTIKRQNNSRTEKLNTNSIVNTNMPFLRGSKLANRGYGNIGKMW